MMVNTFPGDNADDVTTSGEWVASDALGELISERVQKRLGDGIDSRILQLLVKVRVLVRTRAWIEESENVPFMF